MPCLPKPRGGSNDSLGCFRTDSSRRCDYKASRARKRPISFLRHICQGTMNGFGCAQPMMPMPTSSSPAMSTWIRILCIKTERTIRKDNTIALDGRLYQLEERGGKRVMLEERIDGCLVISKGVSLKHREITERPQKEVAAMPIIREYSLTQTFKRSPLAKAMENRKGNLSTRSHGLLTK